MNSEIKVGICGAQGYVGNELIQLVAQHPCLQLAGILVRAPVDSGHAAVALANKQNVSVYSLSDLNVAPIDVLLLATPPEASIEIVASLQNTPIKIIDLSGAFRLPISELKQWYGLEHQLAAFSNGAAYGLSPWLNQQPQNVLANPGCYATCALMALVPLIKQKIMQPQNIIVDAKSGVSGAGKKANPSLHFCEMSQNFFPYKIGKHQHTPEITQALTQLTDQSCQLTFMTHMLPVMRGIAMSVYGDAASHFTSDKAIAQAIAAAYHSAYADYPLAEFAEVNADAQANDLLALKAVVGTPKVHITYFVQDKKIILFSCIDNLLKGAASQAIENINHSYQLPLATGLLAKESPL